MKFCFLYTKFIKKKKKSALLFEKKRLMGIIALWQFLNIYWVACHPQSEIEIRWCKIYQPETMWMGYSIITLKSLEVLH